MVYCLCGAKLNNVVVVSQVGFDIADVQVDLEYVDPSIASRIEWVHGNLYVPVFFLGVARLK